MALLSLKITAASSVAGSQVGTAQLRSVLVKNSTTVGLVLNTVGNQGPPGVGANWRGPWSSGTTYALNDGVTGSDGHNYISLTAGNLNHNPTSTTGFWSDLLPATVVSEAALWISVKQHGAVGNGIADDTAAIQAADAAAGANGVVFFPTGTYLMSSLAATYTAQAGWVGAGVEKTIIQTPDIVGPAVKWQGSAGATVNLAVDLAEFAQTATLTTGGGASFSIGDLALFTVATSSFYGAWLTPVMNVVGDVLTLQETCPNANFTFALGAQVQKITPLKGVRISDITITGPAAAVNVINVIVLNYLSGGTLNNVRVGGSKDAALTLFGCYGTTLHNVGHSEALTDSALGFYCQWCAKLGITGGESHHSTSGISLTGCTRCTVSGRRMSGDTNNLGRGLKLLSGSNYNTVIGNTISSFNKPNITGIKVNDSSGNVINGNTIDSIAGDGINFSSDIGSGTNFTHHNIVKGNQITNCSLTGITLTTGTAAANTFNEVEGNTIRNAGTDAMSVATSANSIKGNIIDGAGSGAGVNMVSGATLNMVEGNTFNVGAQNALSNAGAINYWIRNNIVNGNLAVAAGDVYVPLVTGGVLNYSTTVTPDLRKGPYNAVTATNGTAFTMAAPIRPSLYATLTLDIFNNSGGAMGAITWDAIYLLAGAFTNPATGKRRTITFMYDGPASKWIEVSRAAADI